MSKQPIYVTRPFLPPLEEFEPALQRIWETGILTNGGPFHHEFETRLGEYLGVPQVALFNNATIALIIALRALGISGEVVTTPYSFVATSHALVWNNITPVFADIDPRTLNLDPVSVEQAITSRTTAILPVHCYGEPCDIEGIAAVARRHGLKVIYDAAHAFGVSDARGSILNAGDLSILSFHATKVLNTFEGGAIICPSAERKDQIDKLKNFGFEGETSVVDVGINGKMNEISAALGLLQLRHFDESVAARRRIDDSYRRALEGVRGIRCLDRSDPDRSNFAYFPIFVGPDFPLSRDDLYDLFKTQEIHVRRYFYPLISDFSMYADLPSAARSGLPVAARAADQVLCLPIYPKLSDDDLVAILNVIRSATERTGTAG